MEQQQKQDDREHKELATRIAGEYARQLRASLPRISGALQKGVGQASFTVTAQFSYGKDNILCCTMKPRERIPLDEVTVKCTITSDGQLSLFHGEEINDDPEAPEVPEGGENAGGEEVS